MSFSTECPRCQREVSPAASVCPACKTDLALCGFCRALTTLTPAAGEPPRFQRPRFVCDKCGRLGVRCRTALLGGYCNGLARPSWGLGGQVCPQCTHAVFDAAKTVAAWTLIGVVSSRLRPRR
jgi:hypothetical protein